MSANNGTARNGHFRIGELARRTGVNQRTLRFYEERGLLRPASRFESGMRLYTDGDVGRVGLIRELQDTLGLTLSEIRTILEAEGVGDGAFALAEGSPDEGEPGLKRMIDVTRSQLALIARKVAKLERMREQLEQKLIQYLEKPWTVPGGRPAERPYRGMVAEGAVLPDRSQP